MTRVRLGPRWLELLDHRAKRHDWTSFHAGLVGELARRLRPGMVVYDVGAEEGELTALCASLVGPSGVHIFEPSSAYWPNLRRVWEANIPGASCPGGCWDGFVSDTSTQVAPLHGWPGWPSCSVGAMALESCPVEYSPGRRSITLDAYARMTLRPGLDGKKRPQLPDALLIDVEGCEWLVLLGAQEVLRTCRQVYLSLHDDAWIARYGHGGSKAVIDAVLTSIGFRATLLGREVEEHWLYER